MRYITIVILICSICLFVGCAKQSNNSDSINSEQVSGIDCGDEALIRYNCWTSSFPADIYGKGDVTCDFLISCCGQDIKQGWQTVYPDMAGLRGFVDSGDVISKASCKDLPALGDLDGDGKPNKEDNTPVTNDKKPWDEKIKE